MWRFALAIAYLSLTAAVSPCLCSATSTLKRKKAPREVTLAQFAEKLKIEGEVTQFPAVLVKLMGFQPDATKKTFEAPVSETADGVSRLAEIVFSKSASTDEPVPVGLYWSTRLKFNRKSESYDYRTSLEGTLEKATRIDGQLGGDERE